MLTKTISPKTKAELIAALQAASFRTIEVYETDRLGAVPRLDALRRANSVVIVVSA